MRCGDLVLRFEGSIIFAAVSGSITPGTMIESVLCRLYLCGLATPDPQSRLLDGASKRKRHLPRKPGFVANVDRIQTSRCEFTGLTARKEDDSWHRGRDGSQQAARRYIRNLLNGRLLRTVRSGQYHVRFEDQGLQLHPLREQLFKDSTQHCFRDRRASLERVTALHQHLWFHDRDEACLLTEPSITSECMRIRRDTPPARNAVCDGEDCPPFCEARTHLGILRQPLAQTIQTLGNLLSGEGGKLLCAEVNLNAGKDSECAQSLSEGSAIVLLLVNGLIVKNDAADAFVEPRRLDNQLPLLAVGLRGLGNAPCGETLVAGSRALIDCKQAFAVGNHLPGGGFKRV